MGVKDALAEKTGNKGEVKLTKTQCPRQMQRNPMQKLIPIIN